MKKKNAYRLNNNSWIFIIFLITQSVVAQVGINTTTPDLSSVLDVTSTTKGMLTPRMTTAQKLDIESPTSGLLVYDTDLKSFSYYDSMATSWVRVLGDNSSARLRFKRIRNTDVLTSVLSSELEAGGGTKYLLDPNTYYEINGTIVFDLPIELNSAYVSGMDANVDSIVKNSGDLFTGTTGGSIKMVTIQVQSGGKVFNINGVGQTLILRDANVINCSDIGTLSNFNIIFFSIVNMTGNSNGITFNSCNALLLSNLAWFGSNSGIFEKYTGTFGVIEKIGGIMDVNETATGIDVSSNPIVSINAYLSDVMFYNSGSLGTFVDKYTVGSYVGFNFNNKWRITCGGIPYEGDIYSSGGFYLNRTLELPYTNVSTTGFTKVPGTTISSNLYRFSTGSVNNRLVYNGKKRRNFDIIASIAFEAGGGGVADYVFFFVKWNAAGTISSVLTNTETYVDTNSGNIQCFPITGNVSLDAGEYIELCAKRISGSDKTLTFKSYNMSIK